MSNLVDSVSLFDICQHHQREGIKEAIIEEICRKDIRISVTVTPFYGDSLLSDIRVII